MEIKLNLKTFLDFITYNGLFESVSLIDQQEIAVAILQSDPNHELTYLEHIEENNNYILWLADAWIIEQSRRRLVQTKHACFLKLEKEISSSIKKSRREKPATPVSKQDAMLLALENGDVELATKLGEQIRREKSLEDMML